MQTRTGVIPTTGLPPRPVVTDWRWDRVWDDSVVAARSHWLPLASRVWDQLRIRYPARFDAVECRPITTATDGPDLVTGIRFRVALYPMVYTLDYELPSTAAVDLWLDHLPRLVEDAHRRIRVFKWRLLEPVQPRCPYALWWHPDALAARLRSLPPIPLGRAGYADPR